MSEIRVISNRNSNCFLISGETDCILVDTGSRKYREKILKKIKNYKISLIILTHGHKDNIDNAKFFAEYFNAKIGMNKRDENLVKNTSVHPIYNSSYLGVIAKNIYQYKTKKSITDTFEADLNLDTNFSLKDFNIDCKIIDLPGHTSGSIGVLVDNNKIIVGDTLMNIIKPTPSLFAEDLEKLTKSIQKINELNVDLVYVKHGQPIFAEKFFMKYTQYVRNVNPFA